MPPPDPTFLDSPAVHALSPEDRALLTLILTGPGSLGAIAEETGLDILTLAERILAPEMQAALESIKQAATQLSHVRALIGRPIALAALEAVSTEANPNPIERRRAASTFLRAAPIGYPHAPRGAGYLHAPRGAISAQHSARTAPANPSANQTATDLPLAIPELVTEPIAQSFPAAPNSEPSPEIPTRIDSPPEIHEARTDQNPPTPSIAEPAGAAQTTLNRPKPAPRSRDRPPIHPTRFISLARKPPLIAAA